MHQYTLASEVSVTGKGLHTGAMLPLRLSLPRLAKALSSNELI
jgi:UDP-3-O-acyl-N-acetylglucosamine deacetylase